jgi:carboxyl-terminal processing protease
MPCLMALDPYTEFVPESEIEDYKLHYVSTQYGGIGASIFLRDNKVYILAYLKASRRKRPMCAQGDQMMKINDIDLTGKTTTR